MMIVLALMGSAAYALRGGVIPLGSTQLSRALWAVPCGVLAGSFLGLSIGIAVTVAVFLGLLCGHAAYQHMGTVDWSGPYAPADGQKTEAYAWWLEGTSYWRCAAGLFLAGLVRGALVDLTLWLGMGIHPAVAASWALAHPMAYMIGWALPLSQSFSDRWRLHVCEALFGLMALPLLWLAVT